ncbi:MAG: hypothetical protein NTW96_01415 [Planctomycetia bacterium]|nr:hypothetical protein [Planctomycetia bacterium]
MGERRWYQSQLYHRLRPVERVYDVADLVRMVDPAEYPPTRSSLSPDARKNATAEGVGAQSGPERSAARPSGPVPDFDSLIELITTTIEDQMWEGIGGPGSIAPREQSLSLVINQTPFVHEEIEDLLQKLREAKAARIAGNRGETNP